jgi:hypothetical protein
MPNVSALDLQTEAVGLGVTLRLYAEVCHGRSACWTADGNAAIPSTYSRLRHDRPRRALRPILRNWRRPLPNVEAALLVNPADNAQLSAERCMERIILQVAFLVREESLPLLRRGRPASSQVAFLVREESLPVSA